MLNSIIKKRFLKYFASETLTDNVETNYTSKIEKNKLKS